MNMTSPAIVIVSPRGSSAEATANKTRKAMQAVRYHQASAFAKLSTMRNGQRMKRMHDMYTTPRG